MARTTSVNAVSVGMDEDSSFFGKQVSVEAFFFFFTFLEPGVKRKMELFSTGNDKSGKSGRVSNCSSLIRKWRATGKLFTNFILSAVVVVVVVK